MAGLPSLADLLASCGRRVDHVVPVPRVGVTLAVHADVHPTGETRRDDALGVGARPADTRSVGLWLQTAQADEARATGPRGPTVGRLEPT